jgi:hypothetical protein
MPRPDFFGDDQHAPAATAAPTGRPDFGDQHPAAGGGDWTGTAERLLGATGATIGGVGKGLAQIGAPPGGVSLREADPKGPVATWAKTEDKNYPTAEKAGRLTAQFAPLALTPELGGGAFAAKMVPELPTLARIVGTGLEGTALGGAGGAMQGDAQTGAEAGGGGATGRAAFMAAPGWLKTIIGLAAMEAAREGGGAKLPWGSWHMAHPLAIMAAGLLGGRPGVTGAAAAKMFGGDGGDKP